MKTVVFVFLMAFGLSMTAQNVNGHALDQDSTVKGLQLEIMNTRKGVSVGVDFRNERRKPGTPATITDSLGAPISFKNEWAPIEHFLGFGYYIAADSRVNWAGVNMRVVTLIKTKYKARHGSY